MDSVAEAKHKLGADLHKALEHQSLDVYYQPIVRIDDRSLHGFEALVRWPHPSVGLISPDVFVPLTCPLLCRGAYSATVRWSFTTPGSRR
jgi:sensor c-di-GMP phosphodiesterase-like protein